VIAGGHTIIDREPKYGLAVTGLVHPERLFAKAGAQPGDRLVLTKALGTGVITTAHKRGTVQVDHLEATVAGMLRLNRWAAEAAKATPGVHAITDITGFGLLGHAHEMAHLSQVALEIEHAALPWLPGARLYAAAWTFPGGSERNEAFYDPWIRSSPGLALSAWEVRLAHDPQTSGGLLIAVAQQAVPELVERLQAGGDSAYVIGRVRAGAVGEIALT
jgi:selenide,water dikinase